MFVIEDKISQDIQLNIKNNIRFGSYFIIYLYIYIIYIFIYNMNVFLIYCKSFVLFLCQIIQCYFSSEILLKALIEGNIQEIYEIRAMALSQKMIGKKLHFVAWVKSLYLYCLNGLRHTNQHNISTELKVIQIKLF